MGKSRSERRHLSGPTYKLFSSQTTLGWHVLLNSVPFSQAERMVVDLKWRRVNDEYGNHVGYQALRPDQRKTPTARIIVAVTITQKELERNAGLRGRPGERGVSGRDLVSVEEAIEKVRIWPEFKGVEPGLKPVKL